MSDMLADGAQWLEANRDMHMSQDVSYTRGVETIIVRATIGKTIFENPELIGGGNSFNGLNRSIPFEAKDFLMRVEDLILGGVLVEPAIGDKIAVGGVTYDVMPMLGYPHFRYSDPNRATFRIHTKEVEQLP